MDAATPQQKLVELPLSQLRGFVEVNGQGKFRPLRSSPDLRPGWRMELRDARELSQALHIIYPGAVGDWFAVQRIPTPAISYREYAGRQTGMYRITALLPDSEAATVASACCAPRFCLKRRLWSIADLPADSAADKSAIPCLEPCAVLMELARKAFRLTQEGPEQITFTSDDLAVLAAALETAVKHPDASVREADFSAPNNPRRQELLRARLVKAVHKAEAATRSSES